MSRSHSRATSQFALAWPPHRGDAVFAIQAPVAWSGSIKTSSQSPSPKRWSIGCSSACAAALMLLAPPPAAASCTVKAILELPVRIVGRRAIVTARIGAKEAHFIVDSGAFRSTLSRKTVLDHGLLTASINPRYRLRGANGDADMEIATVPLFTLGGMVVPQARFIVGGSETGWAGLLGQNILGRYDVEYDFPHGAIRLVQVRGCAGSEAAYWAAGRPVARLSLVPRDIHVRARVTVNSTPMKAIFDTGAPSAIMTIAAAKRAGIGPDSPDAMPTDVSGGIGLERVPTWIAPFERLDIAGERIAHPRIRFAAVNLADADMLIGFDYFITHRVLVRTGRSQLLVTDEAAR